MKKSLGALLLLTLSSGCGPGAPKAGLYEATAGVDAGLTPDLRGWESDVKLLKTASLKKFYKRDKKTGVYAADDAQTDGAGMPRMLNRCSSLGSP